MDSTENTKQMTLETDDDWMSLLLDISEEPDDNSKINYKKLLNASDDLIDLEVSVDLSDDVDMVKFSLCPVCDVECKVNDGTLYCESCGLERVAGVSKSGFSSNKDNNTSENSFMSFNIVGKNSYTYQRSFMKTCANYSSFRRNNNRKDLYNYNYQYEGKKIPKNVIKLAIELFSKIKDHNYVFRGNGKKGVLGACLFYSCVMNQITKTPQDIASIMEIEERFLSHGDRIVQELNEKKVISIPTILRPLKDYLDQYFPALKIPDIYKPFVIDIIDKAEKKNIHIQNDSRTTTKCIGAIYLLTTRVPALKSITKDKIVKECSISKSTFIRYYNLLCSNYKLLKNVFKHHKIPMPVEWRTKPLEIDNNAKVSKAKKEKPNKKENIKKKEKPKKKEKSAKPDKKESPTKNQE
jgi:transcription initiation factor TFIIIB Brf1 subunit/transcription initiation factor TFIIB